MNVKAEDMIREYKESQKDKDDYKITISIHKKNALAKIKNFVYNIFRK